MALTVTWCCALQRSVTRVTDLGGGVVCVVCAEREAATGTCSLKRHALHDSLIAGRVRREDWNGVNELGPHCPLG
jgi:hypothetical protein